MAVDLVRRNVAVLVSTGGVPPITAAKAATSIIPIVFTLGTDPVETGVVASLGRPGGNVTGAFLFAAMLHTKRLGLLRDTVPTVTLIAALVNPKIRTLRPQRRALPKRRAPSACRSISCMRATSRNWMLLSLACPNCEPVPCCSAPTHSSAAGAIM
jgi:ABC-type uncharacterized transport system substrate-binding protein